MEIELIYKYLFICLFVILLLTFIGFIAFQIIDSEKFSPYECGFNQFSDARNKFEIRFYLVALLFILFDLELIFLVTWAIMVSFYNIVGLVIIALFLFVLTAGFLYEWSKGALEWE